MKLNIRAILLGAAVDLGGSTFFGAPLSVIWMHWLLANGVAPQDAYYSMMRPGTFMLVSSVLGFGFSFLGGYVAAMLAGRRHRMHGAAAAVPCLMLNVVQSANPFALHEAIWISVGGAVISVTMAFWGGRYASNASTMTQ